VHYVASDEPVGTFVRNSYSPKVCPEKSAGHTRHEYTTGYAHDEILKHFGLAPTEGKVPETKDETKNDEKSSCDIL